MASGPFADIPGHKKFDADLRALASLAKRLAAEAAEKSERAKAAREREAFARLTAGLALMAKSAVELRGDLWAAVE